MGNIRQRKTKAGLVRYAASVRRQGHPPLYASFARLTDARGWIKRMEAAILEGRHSPTATGRRTTVGHLLDLYISQHVAIRSDSFRRQREGHLRWWRQQVGNLRLVDLSRRALTDAIESLRAGNSASGRVPSAATINRYVATMRHVCSRAVQRERLGANPFAKLTAEREPRGRLRVLDQEERKRLLAACAQSRDRRLAPLVALALATGARQGELLSLRWQDVDTLRRVATFHHTKNNERRSVPLSPPALAAFKAVRMGRRAGSDFVFAGRRTASGKRPEFPRKPWLEVCATAQLTDFRFHDLRHTAASMLAMSGATLAELAAILGHKTLAMVQRYAHLSTSHLANVASRMAAQFLRR